MKTLITPMEKIWNKIFNLTVAKYNESIDCSQFYIELLQDNFAKVRPLIINQTCRYMDEDFVLAKWELMLVDYFGEVLTLYKMNEKLFNALKDSDIHTITNNANSFGGFVNRVNDDQAYNQTNTKHTHKDNLRILNVNSFYNKVFYMLYDMIVDELLIGAW